MRVIAGVARGRQIKAPKGSEITRPTADKVREAVFGSLQFQIPGSRVLDLFAGSGAMGIEALSRGAQSAVFVDCDRAAVALIRENLKFLDMEQSAQVLHMDFAAALSRLSGPFDYIFLDPPYKASLYQPAISLILERKLLALQGRIIVEHEEGAIFRGVRVLKEKKYGRTLVSFLAIGESCEVTVSRQL